MEEDPEYCIKCRKQQGLQGVALTVGKKTFLKRDVSGCVADIRSALLDTVEP